MLAVRSEDSLESFADENGLAQDEVEEAIQDGLVAAIDDAEDDGTLPGLVAPLARRAVESVPVWLLLDTLDRIDDLAGLLP